MESENENFDENINNLGQKNIENDKLNIKNHLDILEEKLQKLNFDSNNENRNVFNLKMNLIEILNNENSKMRNSINISNNHLDNLKKKFKWMEKELEGKQNYINYQIEELNEDNKELSEHFDLLEDKVKVNDNFIGYKEYNPEKLLNTTKLPNILEEIMDKNKLIKK